MGGGGGGRGMAQIEKVKGRWLHFFVAASLQPRPRMFQERFLPRFEQILVFLMTPDFAVALDASSRTLRLSEGHGGVE